MARKHENFTYNYGWKTAPEQWRFYLNKKEIHLDYNTRTNLANMCLTGRIKDAEDELKRMLRKEEKNPLIVGKCICFFKKDSDEFYYTQQLLYNPQNIHEALKAYKEWKRYIKEKDCVLETEYTITEGEFSPFRKNNTKTRIIENKVDLTKFKTINIVRKPLFN